MFENQPICLLQPFPFSDINQICWRMTKWNQTGHEIMIKLIKLYEENADTFIMLLTQTIKQFHNRDYEIATLYILQTQKQPKNPSHITEKWASFWQPIFCSRQYQLIFSDHISSAVDCLLPSGLPSQTKNLTKSSLLIRFCSYSVRYFLSWLHMVV